MLINLKITRGFGVLTNANFKVKVKDVLNLYLEVHIPNVVNWVIYLIANDFISKVQVMFQLKFSQNNCS
jgi:hypothetical protein